MKRSVEVGGRIQGDNFKPIKEVSGFQLFDWIASEVNLDKGTAHQCGWSDT